MNLHVCSLAQIRNNRIVAGSGLTPADVNKIRDLFVDLNGR
jgi:signal recognition particle GTPase